MSDRIYIVLQYIHINIIIVGLEACLYNLCSVLKL